MKLTKAAAEARTKASRKQDGEGGEAKNRSPNVSKGVIEIITCEPNFPLPASYLLSSALAHVRASAPYTFL
jgi:hypothetical protein